MSSPHLKKLEAYTAANQECARIVLADPERYGGEESLMGWASLVVEQDGTLPMGTTEAA